MTISTLKTHIQLLTNAMEQIACDHSIGIKLHNTTCFKGKPQISEDSHMIYRIGLAEFKPDTDTWSGIWMNGINYNQLRTFDGFSSAVLTACSLMNLENSDRIRIIVSDMPEDGQYLIAPDDGNKTHIFLVEDIFMATELQWNAYEINKWGVVYNAHINLYTNKGNRTRTDIDLEISNGGTIM